MLKVSDQKMRELRLLFPEVVVQKILTDAKSGGSAAVCARAKKVIRSADSFYKLRSSFNYIL